MDGGPVALRAGDEVEMLAGGIEMDAEPATLRDLGVGRV
jgi:hypothetical protein